jgi:hypothetical protein
MRTVALAVLAMTLAAAAASAQQQAWAEKMFKDGLTHDFGTVARGAKLVHHFTITNIYAVRMEITSLKVGCGCVTATAPKRVLAARESTTIEVRMDTGRIPAGSKTVGVRVAVGPEYTSSAELKITANSRADVVFNPGQVNFGTVTRGAASKQMIDVDYAGALDWQVKEVLAKDAPFTVALKEKPRRRVGSVNHVGYTLEVTLKKDAPAGALKHTAYLKTNDPTNPTVPLLIEANVQQSVTVTPGVLSLGTVKTDTALVRRVIVRGTRPFRVTGVTGTGQGVELGAALSAKDEVAQFVTFKCQFPAAGAFRQELKIKTTLQDDPVTVTVEGTAEK